MIKPSCRESVSRLDLEDKLDSSLAKALAISTFALDENFRNYPDSIKHDCLWAINDYIETSVNIIEEMQRHNS